MVAYVHMALYGLGEGLISVSFWVPVPIHERNLVASSTSHINTHISQGISPEGGVAATFDLNLDTPSLEKNTTANL